MNDDKPRYETNWTCDENCGGDAVCMISDATHWIKWCDAGHVTVCDGGMRRVHTFGENFLVE